MTTVTTSPPIASAADLFALTKPRVMSLVIFTALCGLIAAPVSIHPVLGFTAILAISLGAGASAALNQWYEADIDAMMKRTQNRPLPGGRMDRETALHFGVGLSVFSVLLMGVATNWLAAGLLAFSIFFYAVVYTIWLKRSTPQNIVIGGAAGAAPVLIGWTATGSTLDIGAWLLFLLVFMWTPAHFWALSIENKTDYEQADFPMLPTQETYERSTIYIAIYSCATVLISIAAAPVLQLGIIYLLIAVFLGTNLMFKSYNLYKKRIQPIKYFVFSNTYLAVIFLGIVADIMWTLRGVAV